MSLICIIHQNSRAHHQEKLLWILNPQTCKDGILRKVMPIAKKHYLEINEYSLVFFNKLKKEVSPIAITHTMYQDHYAI